MTPRHGLRQSGSCVFWALATLACGCSKTARPPSQSPPSTAKAEKRPETAPAKPTGPVGRTWSVRRQVHPDLPVMVFTLVGESQAPDAPTMRVHAIEIRQGDQPQPVQSLSGLQTEVTLDERAFIIEDMNFDGYQDLRLAESTDADRSPYLCWLYDPAAERFVRNEQLEALIAPRFDAEHKQVQTRGDDSTTQTYIWRAGSLITEQPR